MSRLDHLSQLRCSWNTSQSSIVSAGMVPIHTNLSLPAPLALGIAPGTAHLLSLLFTTTYVGLLYLAQNIFLRRPAKAIGLKESTTAIPATPIAASASTPSGPEVGSRDHPETIRIRLRAVGIATALSLAGVLWTVRDVGVYTWAASVSEPIASLLPGLTRRSSNQLWPFWVSRLLSHHPLQAPYFRTCSHRL